MNSRENKSEMKFYIDSGAKKILKTLEENGHSAYLVGGCIRDLVMGISPKDWDITTSATPIEVMNIFSESFPTGIEHGTITVMVEKVGYEVTTYRVDGKYEDFRHPKSVEFTDDIVEDLARRDFTINSMAYNPKNGILDVFGGINDIENKVVRCVGDPDRRFSEDALRILRAIRFSARLGFTIEKNTIDAMVEKGYALKNISFERISSEFDKTIKSNMAFLEYYNKIEFIKKLFFDSDFKACIFDIENLRRYETYIEDIFKNMNKNHIDVIDKNIVDIKRALSIYSLMGIDKIGVNKFLSTFRYSNKEKKATVKILDEINTSYPIGSMDRAYIKEILRRVGDIDIAKCAIFAKFITEFQNPTVIFDQIDDIIILGECFSVKQLKINGSDVIDILGLKGAKIGEILENTLDYIIQNPEQNVREKLIEFLKNRVIMEV